MTQRWRVPTGGILDRSRTLAFEFDGSRYAGHPGDTLASGLLANGVHLVARSFKYHRPRGIFTAGPEEPNALVQLARGARTEANTRATTVELYDGLVATSQNRWPSLRFDAGAIANALSPLLPAGFYYKTFMWPPSPKWWLRYERFIRAAAGMGRVPDAADPDRYAHRFAHCDVLVIGGGPAGLAAAGQAAQRGARVIVCDESMRLATVGSIGEVDNAESEAPLATALTELRARDNVTLLARTTAFGYYDDDLVAAVERVADHLAEPPAHLPRQRMWLIRAGSVVLAAGAIERGVAYSRNDLPGTMLAGAVAEYAERYAIRLGTRAVVFTSNDRAYEAALALRRSGVRVEAVVDARPAAKLVGELPRQARDNGIEIVPNAHVACAHGRLRVEAVDIATRADGSRSRIACDLVAVSGGYSPTVHLYAQARGALRYDSAIAAFVPDASPMAIVAAGAARGIFDSAAAVADGRAAADRALERAAQKRSQVAMPASPTADDTPSASTSNAIEGRSAQMSSNDDDMDPLWAVPGTDAGKSFIDLQDDVTVRDVALAAREGYRSVEHLKRYTTLGMGTDQGKTSNLIGLAVLGEQLRARIPDVGTTTFRPPYTPVTFGALPGHACGPHVEPTRRTAMHEWHAAQGARFVNAGLWKRPHSYPREGESEDAAADREARNVRRNVGAVDVSTLGKIELQGPDVARFLNRIYINRFDTLQVGRCRYGVMLRDDGIVRDDGTVSRLDATHYLVTTTTANAAAIMQHVERLLQVDWPDLDVYATSVTENWAAIAVSGPRSRHVVAQLVDIDVANAGFPFLAVAACRVRTREGDAPGRLFRMSYSGELAYEIHVPASAGLALWEAMLAAGAPFGLMPYGTEAMNTLRVEKGHVVVGAEIDGRTTAADLGMEKLVNPDKWCVGKPLLGRAALNVPDRWQLVGLTAQRGAQIPRGGKLVANPDRVAPNPMLGHVTSWCASPHVGGSIALALLAGGRSRHGESFWVVSPLANARAQVTVGPSCFIDPAGERLRG